MIVPVLAAASGAHLSSAGHSTSQIYPAEFPLGGLLSHSLPPSLLSKATFLCISAFISQVKQITCTPDPHLSTLLQGMLSSSLIAAITCCSSSTGIYFCDFRLIFNEL